MENELKVCRRRAEVRRRYRCCHEGETSMDAKPNSSPRDTKIARQQTYTRYYICPPSCLTRKA